MLLSDHQLDSNFVEMLNSLPVNNQRVMIMRISHPNALDKVPNCAASVRAGWVGSAFDTQPHIGAAAV